MEAVATKSTNDTIENGKILTRRADIIIRSDRRLTLAFEFERFLGDGLRCLVFAACVLGGA